MPWPGGWGAWSCSPALLGWRCPSPWPLSHGSQAIRELQDEVWRLRLQLEESLRHSHSYPKGRATPRVTLGRRQPVTSAPLSPKDAAPVG